MKLAIMQPYFFPYIGYFSLIKNTDQFILFDTVQFIRHGWIDRNRVLKPNDGWQYISIPLIKHSQQTLIKDIVIKNEANWRDKIISQIGHYKKKAPFYNETLNVVNKAISIDTQDITLLNYNVLKVVCEYLGIKFNCDIFSKMNLDIEAATAPDEWALNICKAINDVTEYWNPQGGVTFFDKFKYDKAGIKLKLLKPHLDFYSQRRGEENFENGLSIIDVMMFNSPEQIRLMLDNYELI